MRTGHQAMRLGMAASGLTYVLAVFTVPVMAGATPLVWALTIASVPVFSYLYFDFLRHVQTGARRALLDLGLMAALGFGLVPLNLAATTYIVYTAALAPVALVPRRSIALMIALAIGTVVELSFVSGPERLLVGGWIVFLIFTVGVGNLFIADRERRNLLLQRAQEDVEEMAKVAERERIARDLHDLVGHTLSVIVLKSELASKLAERDPARAAREIREVERVSRSALAEVRGAVEGYRSRGFSGELKSARQTLGSAGVRLDADVHVVPLSPKQETVLALVLRETVTNVVRHARASVCRVGLGLEGSDLVLTIHDDGVGGPLREGNGLSGMRERVTAAGGGIDVDGARGVKVRVRLPAVGVAPS